jgi:hypothetical protein
VIHVIHQPDEPGLACQFEQGAVDLPWPIFRSQPHFPNYRLGPLGQEGLPCTPVVSVSEPVAPHEELWIYPNPTNAHVTIRWTHPVSPDMQVRVYDALGRKIAVNWLAGEEHTIVLETNGLSTGVHYVEVLTTDGQRVQGKFIKR